MDRNPRIIAATGALLFSIMVVLLLWFITFTSLPQQEPMGVEVEFGNIDEAKGEFDPQGEVEAPPIEEATVTPVAPVEEELITQEEPSLEVKKATPEKKKKDPKKQEELEKKRLAEADRKRIQEEERQKAIANNRISGAFGKGAAQQGSQGDDAQGEGNRGSREGNSATGAATGIGGYGTWNLNGRSIGGEGLPRPSFTASESGQIVVAITVAPEGNVIDARVIAKGTDISDLVMRRKAEEAARRARFNTITSSNNQQGTITYRYKLQ